MTQEAHKDILENGIRVLSESMEGVRSVSVGVLVDVGSRDEMPDERGYAHLVEHMLFQGTNERDALAIAEMMDVGGGAIGAFTSRDYTVYHATVLDEYLPFALEVLGDMLCNSILPAEALERQRSVILTEITRRDNPIKQVNSLLKATLWSGSPLGSPTAGLEETIRSASRETLVPFKARHYIANKLILAAAGSLEHERFVSQARDSFWQMQKGDVPSQPPMPEAAQGAIAIEKCDLQQVYFSIAWSAPAYVSPERYAYHVFARLLGGGPTSRLYRTLREEKGMVYHISAQYQAYGSAGALAIQGATPASTLVPVLAGTIIELLRMADEPIDPDDFHRAVDSLVSQHLVSGDSAYVRMSRLALQELYFGRAITSDQITDGLRAQTIERVQDVAHDILDAGMPAIALVGPVSPRLEESLREMLAQFFLLARSTAETQLASQML